MNKPLRHKLPALIFVIVTTLMIHHPVEGQAIERKPSLPAKSTALVEALVSRNQPPALVKHELRTVPVFARDYDWHDQDRVKKAFYQIRITESAELWEQLVAHRKDTRYALTMSINSPNYENMSVGKICGMIAWDRLLVVRAVHSNPNLRDRADVDLVPGIIDLGKWRAEREAKSLFELQIDVCEIALGRLGSTKKLSESVKALHRETILDKIDKLRESQRPIFYKLSGDLYGYVSAENAEIIRNKVKAELKQSEIQLGDKSN